LINESKDKRKSKLVFSFSVLWTLPAKQGNVVKYKETARNFIFL